MRCLGHELAAQGGRRRAVVRSGGARGRAPSVNDDERGIQHAAQARGSISPRACGLHQHAGGGAGDAAADAGEASRAGATTRRSSRKALAISLATIALATEPPGVQKGLLTVSLPPPSHRPGSGRCRLKRGLDRDPLPGRGIPERRQAAATKRMSCRGRSRVGRCGPAWRAGAPRVRPMPHGARVDEPGTSGGRCGRCCPSALRVVPARRGFQTHG